jgi:predicted ATP-dependent serine protease
MSLNYGKGREGRGSAREKTKYYCVDCGKEISKYAIRCVDCENKNRITEKPVTREELKKLIRNFPFTTIATKFGVTDNAIRKWCDSYNLPRTKTVIKKYSDEEWELI